MRSNNIELNANKNSFLEFLFPKKVINIDIGSNKLRTVAITGVHYVYTSSHELPTPFHLKLGIGFAWK